MKNRRFLIVALLALALATGLMPGLAALAQPHSPILVPVECTIPDSQTATDTPAGVEATLVANQVHIFLVLTENRLQVGEFYVMGYTGSEPYEGMLDPSTGTRVVVPFSLPPGAGNLRFEGTDSQDSQGTFALIEDGFAYTEPVPPGTGTSQIRFTYDLPFQDGMSIERTFAFPVASLAVFAAEGIEVSGDTLQFSRAISTDTGAVLSYISSPIMPGMALRFNVITGTAPVSAPAMTGTGQPAPLVRETTTEVIVGVVVLLASLVLAYFFWQGDSSGNAPAKALPVLASIANLDSMYEAGDVPEERYLRRRESLKQQVRVILQPSRRSTRRRA